MKVLKFCFFLCTLLFCTDSIAQENSRSSYNFEYATDLYSVTKVNFHGPSGIGSSGEWIVIKSDFDPNVSLSGNKSSVAWENGEKVTPIAYVSGVRARVSAEFDIICNQGEGMAEYYARAKNVDGYDLPVSKLQYSNGKYIYPRTKVAQMFPNQVVGYWEDFELEWQISTTSDPLGQWIDAGTSKNYMYVTYKNPVTGIQPFGHEETITLQHTFLHIGCNNAKSLSNENQIVDAIYNNEFTDRDVRRFDGAGPIQYWGPNNLFSPQCWQPSQMLVLLNGTCGGWAALLDVVLHIQGIDNAQISTVTYNNYVMSSSDYTMLEDHAEMFFGDQLNSLTLIEPDVSGFTGVRTDFFVKDWNTENHPKFVVNEFRNLTNNITPVNLTLNNQNVIAITFEDGAEGQGNENPRSEFENHAIVKFNNKYYDPSYGSPISSDRLYWETQSLDGFGSIMFFQASSNMGYFINWFGHLNDNSIQQSFINP